MLIPNAFPCVPPVTLPLTVTEPSAAIPCARLGAPANNIAIYDDRASAAPIRLVNTHSVTSAASR